MSDTPISMAAVLAMLTQSAEPMIEPIAVSCVGLTERRTVLGNGETDTVTEPQTRTYILDEERNDVAIYHQDFESRVYLCSGARVSCHFDFYPGMIFLRKQSVGPDSHVMYIDRKTGAVFDMSTSEFGGVTFDGICTKIEIPDYDPSQNAF